VGNNACGQSILKSIQDTLVEAGKRRSSGGYSTKMSYKNKRVMLQRGILGELPFNVAYEFLFWGTLKESQFSGSPLAFLGIIFFLVGDLTFGHAG
jgi:hypothetical protein